VGNFAVTARRSVVEWEPHAIYSSVRMAKLDHSHVVPRYLKGIGTEIGAFTTPIPGISPIYVDHFETFAGVPTAAEYYGDATSLPFEDNSLNYVASSHVIEHAANPLAALKEWYRVLKHRGVVYCVVPDRRKTFDRNRALTDPEHFWTDFQNGTSQVDGMHIDDFCFGVDWSILHPNSSKSDYERERQEAARQYHAAVSAGLEINIHFHTFEPDTFVKMIKIGNDRRAWSGRFEVCEVHESFPAHNPIGFLVVARVFKTLGERWRGLRSSGVVKPGARRFGPAGMQQPAVTPISS
jgi:SAM-dependent methyltransferase